MISVDNHMDVHPTVCADVRALPLKPFDVDLIWASPPCSEFTIMRLPFTSCVKRRPVAGPDLSVVIAIRQILEEWKPPLWVVENVESSRPYLEAILGPIAARSEGHVYWSNQALLMPQGVSHKKFWANKSRDRRRYLARALVPWEVSCAIANMIEAPSWERA